MSLTLLFQDTGTLPTKIAQEGMGFQFPPPASTNAEKFDSLYTFITNVGIFFTVLIFGVLFWLVWRFRQSNHPKAERTATHNTPLELVWSILPGFVLAYMFWVGFKDFLDFRTPPSDAYEIQVTGQKWKWSFRYPGGYEWDELHVPVDQPVTLRITSTDVLHSFFIPAFRSKMDAVPGRYTKLWFTATRTGEFAALCTEYCGTQHSDMLAKVFVETPEEHAKFIEKISRWWEGKPPIEVGSKLYTSRGCAQCHSLDGTVGQGPSWKGIWGKTEQTNKGPRLVDENYIRESIEDPNAAIVNGFNPIMPTYKGRFKDPELEGLFAFIKSLGD